MAETPAQPGSSVCAWCGYDTVSVDAEQCAECGGFLADSGWIRPLLAQKDTLVLWGWVSVLLFFVCVVLWMNTQRGDLELLLLFCAVFIGLLSLGVLESLRVWRRLKRGGRAHPQRRVVLTWLLIYLGQFFAMGTLQLIGTLVIWQ
ncbi:MAG: hypothetical protein LAT64_07650 [Phycisphaerales bacterium]|nr:hypothetical protein [Planctomycetota bacterium]MCH8508630.1 hypothetical protein [Phycisphaerales bacterium]